LRLFARVGSALERAGFRAPILVGGAAVELYSQNAIATGDFDLVSSHEDVLEDIFVKHGFIKPSGPGQLTRGWIHPELELGFEIVGHQLLDGAADLDRLKLISFEEHGNIHVIAVEDLIADRMGQYASGTADEHLEQAKILFMLYKDVDLHYMETRIRQETNGLYGIEKIQYDE